MRALKRIRLRLRSLFRGHRVEQDLDEELRDHLERQIEFHVAAGLSPAEARHAALREFGNIPLIQEQCRDTRRVNWMEDLLRDLQYALRSMRRTPAHTAVAVLSLAFAVGANTATFTIVNVLMLRDLPVANPRELVELARETPNGPGSFSYPVYERIRDQNTVFSDVFAVSSPTVQADGDSADRPPIGRYVSGSFFEALGIQAALGRVLTPDDDRPDAPGGSTLAVIGYGLWQRNFGGDPGVIGRTLRIGIGAVPFTIVGVLPRTFDGLIVGRADEFYLPIASEPRVTRNSLLNMEAAGWLKIIGRLKKDASRAAAKADVEVIFSRYVEDAAPFVGDTETRRRRAEQLTTESARAGLSAPRREFAGPVLLLMGAVALVLLIACANVVNLLLARALGRRREIGIRLALGASRIRVIRQLLTESAALGLMAGGGGLAFAIWGTGRIAALMTNGDPAVAFDVAPDRRVLLFTIAISLGSALLAGVIPALRVSRSMATPFLREDSRTITAGRTVTLWNRTLIAGQVALSLLLLAGALLLVTTLRNLRTFDFGFDREHVLTMRLDPGRAGYTGERLIAYFREVLERARSTSGVRAAALSLGMPVIGAGINTSFGVEGQPRDPDAQVYVNEVSDGYFTTTETRLLLGRDFEAQDRPGSTPVAIINDTIARRYFKAQNPIGQRISMGRRGVREVVGVVATSKYQSLREIDSPIVYVPALQTGDRGGLTLSVKTDTDPGPLAPAIRRKIQNIAAAPVSQPSTLSAQIDRTLTRERLIARVLGVFAVLALVLAAAGLYGVLAYAVTRRTHEIGIRLALGAKRGTVMRSVLRESLMLLVVGVTMGVGAGLALTRVLTSVLYGVTATDPWVLSGAVACLFVVALAASAVPAWRAMRVDPLVALRCE